MLNAHTLTRTFRESQFDIRVFLETLRTIISEPSVPLVESRWADGSVDTTPTLDFINLIVGSTGQNVQVGDISIEPGTTKPSLNVTGGIGVSAAFTNIGDSNLDVTYKDSQIDLIEAKTIKLMDSGTPISIGNVDSIKSSSIQQNRGACKFNQATCTSADVLTSVDISPIVYDGAIRVHSTNEGSSQLLQYCLSNSTEVRTSIVLSGPICLASAGTAGDYLRQVYAPYFVSTLTKLYMEVANIGSAGYRRSDALVGYSIASTNYTTSQTAFFDTFGLYPKLNGKAILNKNGTPYCDFVFTFEAFSESDNYKVIEVQNITSTAITLCNVWYIRLFGDTKMSIQAGNHVVIPPYSRIDFLLLWNEFQETQTRVVRMMPMKALKST